MSARLLHVMMRVFDLNKSLDFYVRILGMKVLRQRQAAEERYTNTFLGYTTEDEGTVIELTYNWDQSTAYEQGTAYGHIAIGVADVYATCERLAAEGVKISRPPGPLKSGKTVIAFVEDPDGHKIELIEHKPI